ncbi:hypothetical protein CIB48_g385 [Xylaria polymorpha]|nr:hypothetical protein CIB48_g385 [Xylaria polymorpha]
MWREGGILGSLFHQGVHSFRIEVSDSTQNLHTLPPPHLRRPTYIYVPAQIYAYGLAKGLETCQRRLERGLLLTWMGGLQLPAPNAERLAHEEISESSWRWARPVPGMTIVNMGDALEVLTNGALTSGLHRVVHAPAAQAPHDRYSVLISLRPANTWPMTPLESPAIPPLSDARKAAPVLTCVPNGTPRN